MYEVAVPVLLDTWAGRHYVSDWAESILELSDNVVLKSPFMAVNLIDGCAAELKPGL
jgi:hypothetical protein